MMGWKFGLGCLVAAVLWSSYPTAAQAREGKAQRRITRLLGRQRATVGVAVLTDDGTRIAHNADMPLPLLSIFKFHVALAVLDRMDREGTGLDGILRVEASRLRPGTYSPLRDRFPDRDIDLSLGDLLRYSVSQSDNNACDILIDYAGGIGRVNDYIARIGAGECALSQTEAAMQRIGNQRLNRSSPAAVARLMKKTMETPPFDVRYRDFLWQIMRETVTGADKLKGRLPPDVIVGHKTGSSDRTPDGTKIADNDAGFVVLPDGRTYYIAVFVTESQQSDRTNAALIARISRIVYDAMTR